MENHIFTTIQSLRGLVMIIIIIIIILAHGPYEPLILYNKRDTHIKGDIIDKVKGCHAS